MKKDIFLNTQICTVCGCISEGAGDRQCYYCNGKTAMLEGINFWNFDGHRGDLVLTTQEDRDKIRLNFQPKEMYDQRAWLCREHYEESWHKFGIPDDIWGTKYQNIITEYNPDVIPAQCPHCTSYFTTKISTGSKLFSVGLFGLASNKVGKQWYCHTCKTYF